MNEMLKGNRRQFIVSALAAGGAMVVGPRLALANSEAQVWDKDVAPANGAAEFTPWLTINPDDTVIVRVAAVDIGNGTLTQACSFVMEELGSKWENLIPEYADPNADYKNGGVYSKPGSLLAYFSGRSTNPDRASTYMLAAATAREQLKAAAAQAWGVPANEIVAKDSTLSHQASGKSARFGEMIAAAAQVKLDGDPKLKDPSEWTWLTKQSPGKVQIPKIVNGSAIYGMDVRLPDMVYAALRQSPVHGGKLVSYDADAIKNMPGVLKVVAVKPKANEPTDLKPPFPFGVNPAQEAVAVIAEHYWQARTALDALPVVWDDGPGAQWTSTAKMNQAAFDAVSKPGEKVELSQGTVDDAAWKAATKVVEGTYLTPFCEQAPMEPLNGTALVTKDRVDLWHPSAHTQEAFYVAADEAGVDPKNVYVHQPYVGGSFGRRVFGDDSRMVVAIAKQFPGRPVHVIWSREEATRQGRYRPLMAGYLKAGLGADGMPTVVEGRMSGGPGFYATGMADTAFTLVTPNAQVTSQIVPFHILQGPYRGPGYNSNAFFVETFVDELAHAAGMDPMDYRIKLYSKWADKGWVKTLTEVRDKSGWGKDTLPKGQGRGVAVANWGMGGKPDEGTTVATVAKVEVTKAGDLKILQLDVAFDTGKVFNEDAVRAEMEGGTLFGLNMSLNEGLNINNGQIVEGNFDQYPIIRMADTPANVNVHFGGLTGNARYNEVGEPPAGVIGPAVGNAIFAAIGKRIRQTPFRTQDLTWS
ncbi:MAG TPA: molybdopterin cofactor-binding domain-containing protein [Devosia sp.]|nr:molybdopterin cofactor-binding domain-containing protein [Devosia sp.]